MINKFIKEWFLLTLAVFIVCMYFTMGKINFATTVLPILVGCGIATALFLAREKFSKNLEHQSSYKIKMGLDLHGGITEDPKFFSAFTKLIVNAGGEIHILTGPHITDKILNELKNFNITYTHLFSIADYYKNKPEVVMEYDTEGRPWVSDELWNKAKGQYAAQKDLDLVLDDTLEYGKYFTTSFAHCTMINKSGIARKPKAKMPPSMLKKQMEEQDMVWSKGSWRKKDKIQFELDKEQIQALEEWKKELPDEKTKTAIGGRFTFSFTPSGVGVFTEVTDNNSKTNLDLTGES